MADREQNRTDAFDWLDAEESADRAQRLVESHEWEQALVELDAVIAVHPHEALWHTQRAQVLDELDRLDEAAEAYRQAHELDPDSIELTTCLVIALIRVGRYEEAVRFLEDLARRQPDYEPAFCHSLAAYTRLGDHDKAEEMFYSAQQINDQCPNCFHHLAESLACRGLFEKALYCWQRVLEIDPDYPQVHRRMAQVYRIQGDHGKARESCLAARRQYPADFDVLADLGDLLVDMKDYAGATAKYTHLLELKPGHARASVMLALMEMRVGRYDSAIPRLESVLIEQPDYPGLYGYLGEAWLGNGDVHRAMTFLTTALEQDPRDMIALLAMGNSLLLLQRASEATTYYLRALEVEPATATALHNLAVCRFMAGAVFGGLRYCARALRLEPRNVALIHKTALALARLEHWAEAKAVIEQGLALQPDHTGLRELARKLRWMKFRCFLDRLVPHRSDCGRKRDHEQVIATSAT